MRIVVFDPFHGAAGDMITGGLLDCGADREIVVRVMQSVVSEPGISVVTRCGIKALKVDTHAPATPRTLAEVMVKLDAAASRVPGPVLAMALRVFGRINAAEEEVHGVHTHFHEVGADDAIADVIGACMALHTLNPDGVVVRPIALGHGVSSGSHGKFPIPAPATVAILRGTKLATLEGDAGELCTPTGAALLAEFSTMSLSDIGTATIHSVGYGAGTRDPADVPNVIRVMLVETAGGNTVLPQDCVDILETNVDDITGELIAGAITRFMDAGARDASAAPIIMKKGRPGYLIRVICSADCSPAIAELMARELGTLGIRCTPAVHRFIADRSIEEVEVVISGQSRKVPVKCGRIHGEVYLIKAEFDHARDWAAELGVPVRNVIDLVEATARTVMKER